MKKLNIFTFTLLFISCSLIGGNMNRDESIKYYHLKSIITGETNNKIRTLDFTGLDDPITNDDLKYIIFLPEVEAIHLSDCKKITDEGLKYLSGLEKLEILNLPNTKITDAGLKHLKNLKSLRDLDLYNTNVTDKGIQELASIESLRMLLLHGTKVTQKGIDELKKKLPDCYITLETYQEIGYNL